MVGSFATYHRVSLFSLWSTLRNAGSLRTSLAASPDNFHRSPADQIDRQQATAKQSSVVRLRRREFRPAAAAIKRARANHRGTMVLWCSLGWLQ